MANKSKKQEPEIDSQVLDMNKKLSDILRGESYSLFGSEQSRSDEILGIHNRYNSLIQQDYRGMTMNKNANDSTFEYISNNILNRPHDYGKEQKLINQPGATTGNPGIDKMLKNRQLEELFTMGDSQIAAYFLSTSSEIMHIYDEIDSVCAYFWQLDEAASKIRDDVLRADRVNEDISMDIRFPGITQDTSSYISTVKQALEYQNIGIKIRDHVAVKGIKYGKYFIMITPFSEIGERLLSLNSGTTYSSQAFYESTDTHVLLADEGFSSCMESVTSIFESFSDNLTEDSSGNKKLSKEIEDKLKIIETNMKSLYVCDDNSVPDIEGLGKYKELSEVIKQSSLDAIKKANEEIEELKSPTHKSKLKLDIKDISIDTSDFTGGPTKDVVDKLDKEIQNSLKTVYGTGTDNETFKELVDKAIKASEKGETGQKQNERIIYSANGTQQATQSDLGKFENITGCHCKLVDPRQLREIKIFDYVIGYYYFENYDFARMGTTVTDIMSNQMNFDQRSQVIDTLVDNILKNLKYGDVLKGDTQLRSMILNCVLYAERRDNPIRIKFVKPEYVIPWQTNLDEDGNGQPVMLRSLMYARLYTSLQLFFATAIVTKSTDSEFYYLKESALDGQINNQISDMMDQLEDSNIDPLQIANGNILHGNKAINKRFFMNMGTDEVKPFEMDVISGQQIDINMEFLQDLKKSALGATSVPSVAIDAMDEMELATTLGMLNINHLTRCNGIKKDYNKPLTQTVKTIIKYCFPNSIPPNILDKMEISLRESKVIEDNINNEQVSNNIGLAESMLSVWLGGDNTNPPDIHNFVVEDMKRQLVMYLNPSAAWDQLPNMYKTALMNARKQQILYGILTKKAEASEQEETE